MASNPFDPSALLSTLPTLLPPTSPKLTNPLSALTALLHTTLSALSFRLQSHTDSPLSPPPSSNTLLPSWDAHSPESHTLLYKHPRSSLTYLFKLIRLGDKLLIHGRSLESPVTASIELLITDYTSASFFPWEPSSPEPLVHGFISSARVSDFVSLIKVGLVAKLAPGLEKEGLETSATTNEQQPPPQGGPSRPRQPDQAEPPYALPPRQPSFVAPRNPLAIGSDDLNPPGLPPSNPFALPRLFDPSAGGMLVGPNHPIFGDRGVGGVGELPRPGRGRWGGDGWLPEGAVPPGARFDPIGPGPLPRFPGRGNPLGGPGRFGGAGGLGGGRMPPGFGGEPDNDEFLPPGMEGPEGGEMPPEMRDMYG